MNNLFNLFQFDEDVDINVEVLYDYLNRQNVNETYISKKPIENRSKIGRQRLDELKLDAVDVEFVEL